MNYQQTLDYLFSQLPMYQRVGKMAYKANLDNTLALDKYFNHPHTRYQTIHVAGTNGKGSTSHMLASVLMEAGYRVGLYTSPHIRSFTERIRVNGQPVSEEFVVQFTDQHKQLFEDIKPSFFEMTVAMAFEYFAAQHVEVAVIETGLGGRLDSTNIISPIVSIITNIGLDHTDLLGATLELIATEKAGIIKKNTPIVIGQTQPETEEIFRAKALELNTPILFADKIYQAIKKDPTEEHKQRLQVHKNGISVYNNLQLDLLGQYQTRNVPGVLAAIDMLNERGFSISQEHILNGLSNAAQTTGLMGRWQIIGTDPLTICDTAHNVEGIELVVEQIALTGYEQLHFVLGMVSDKNIDKVLSILPKNAYYYFTKASIPRAMDQNELAKNAKAHGLQGAAYPTVKEAVSAAKANSQANDLIFIGGSTFTVADALI